MGFMVSMRRKDRRFMLRDGGIGSHAYCSCFIFMIGSASGPIKLFDNSNS